MTTVVEQKKTVASTKLINAKNVTIIPNSRAEHCIYTYSTHVDSHFDIKNPDFYHPLYTFVQSGDILRIFRYDQEKLVQYYEIMILEVDKINKKVTAAMLLEKSVTKGIIGKE